MPWHLSKSDPRKVYDERHEPVCVCQTPEQAARIVAAVTGKSQEVVRLREPVVLGNLSELSKQFPDAVMPDPERETISLTDSFEPDGGCCTARIMKSSRDGVLKSLTSWECQKCGTEWTPTSAGMFRHWSPKPAVMIFGGKR